MTESSNVHSRYLTLGGAQVVMTPHPDTDRYLGYYAWVCVGCQERVGMAQPEIDCRRSANRHAGICRAIPPERR